MGFTQVRHRFSNGGQGDWSTGRASAHGGVSHWVVRGVHGVAKEESQVRRAIYGHIIIWICSKCSSDFKWKWIVCCRSQMIQMVNSCLFKEFWVEMEWPQSHGKRICHKWIWLGRPFRGEGADNSCRKLLIGAKINPCSGATSTTCVIYAILCHLCWHLEPQPDAQLIKCTRTVKMEETDRIQAGAVAIWHWAYPCFESAPSSHAHSSLKHCL